MSIREVGFALRKSCHRCIFVTMMSQSGTAKLGASVSKASLETSCLDLLRCCFGFQEHRHKGHRHRLDQRTASVPVGKTSWRPAHHRCNASVRFGNC